MSALHQSLQRAAQRINPDEYIPVVAYDDENGIFLTDDGYIGVCYWGDPVNGADDSTAEMLKGAFSVALPEGSFVQLSIIGMPDVDIQIGKYRQRREMGLGIISDESSRMMLDAYYNRRADFMSASAKTSNLPSIGTKIHDRRVVLSVKTPYKGVTPSLSEMDALAETGSKLAESLQTFGLFLRRMNSAEYLELAFRLTHPFEDRKLDGVREDQSLKQQVFLPGESIETKKDELVINDETHVQMLSVGRWPKQNALSLMAFMIGDPLGANNQIKMPYHISLTLHYPNQYGKTTALKQKAGMINYQAFGPMLRFVPKLAFKKQGMDVLVNAIEQGATVVEASLTMSVYSKEREECARQISSLRTYFQSFDFAMGEERFVVLPSFWNSFPLFPTTESIKNTFRFKTMAIEQAMTFAPMMGEWKGTSAFAKPGKGYGMMLQSRRGQLMSMDLYDSPTNYNGVIFASSGAGKSFLTQAMIMDYMSMGAKVWVIDVGRSYLKLAKLLKGSFIEFGADSGICLNPFSSIKDIDEEVALVQATIEKMAAPEDGLDDLRRSRIEEAVKAVWGRMGPGATITDVADYFSNSDDQRLVDLGNMLYRFTRYGSEGYWFDGKANVDMSNDLVVLELEELKGKKTLQQVVLMQLISTIQREMYLSNDGRPKILIIDEAWDLLDDPMVGRFMEHAYRRFRKYGGAAIVVTQSIADLYKSDSGRAIAANSAFKLILKQSAEAVEQVKKDGHLALGDYGFYLLNTIHSIPGKYSEVMFYTEQGTGVARLVVDRFSQVLFSTSGTERTEVIANMESGMNPVQAVESYIQKYG